MDLILPPLRQSRISRVKVEERSDLEKGLRKMAKGFAKYNAISLKVQPRKSLSDGLSAGIAAGHKSMGDGCYRSIPLRSISN
jgi:hypothetical protein